jgi:ABC-2 type transport system permease protein
MRPASPLHSPSRADAVPVPPPVLLTGPAVSDPVPSLPPPRRRLGHELSGLAAIAQRDLAKLARDPLRLAVSLAFPVMLIAGLGYVLQPTVGKATGLNELEVAFTGVLAATMFQSAAAGMISVVEDRENDFARELFVTPVSRLTLVSGKVLGETLVALVQGLFIVVFALAFGLDASAHQIAVLIVPSTACGLLGASFGLATVAALPNQRSAMQIFQFLIIPQYVLGGVLVPVHGLPPALEALAWAMPLTYGVDFTRAVFYQGKPAYSAAVSLGPEWAMVVMAAMFAVFVVTGALVFNYRERHR